METENQTRTFPKKTTLVFLGVNPDASQLLYKENIQKKRDSTGRDKDRKLELIEARAWGTCFSTYVSLQIEEEKKGKNTLRS